MPAKNIVIRIALVGLLVLLAAGPLVYQYFASVLSLKPGLGGTVMALDFTTAPESTSGPDFVLAYASLASELVQEGNYTEAKRLLGMTGKLSPNIEHDLRTYVTLTNELVLILDSLKSQSDQLQALVVDGAVAQASEMIRGIDDLIADGSRHLDLLFSSLDRIRAIYHVDVSTQEQNLEVFSSRLFSFEELLSKLKMQVEAIESRAATQLDLAVSPNPVQIDGYLQISGQLRSGRIGLGDRIVELWVNGIEMADLTTDHLGMFDWRYLASSSAQVYEVEVYARYSPIGNDASGFRPAKSVAVTVPVEYQSVVLTIALLSKRALVLEEFTVQGFLTDSSGQPLPMETVRLLVDGITVNSSLTDWAGMYRISTSLPAGSLEGEHQLYTRFDPNRGIHASAASDKIAIQLYYLMPIVSQLALSGLTVVPGEFVALSGQTAQLEGRLEIASKPLGNTLAVAFLEGRELGRALSQTDGVFHIPIRIPYDVSGENKIAILLFPNEPWIAPKTASVTLRVLNSAVIGLAIGATIFALLVFSGKSIDLRSILRRRTALRIHPEPETVAAEGFQVEDRAVSTPVTLGLRDFKLELDLALKIEQPRAYLKTLYWETRRIFGEVLGASGESSETPREYEARVMDRLGPAAPSLSAITRLFELAEYSEHAISHLEAQEGRDHAFRVAEEMSARVQR